MKQLIILLALAFLIMVGVVIGTRMSSDALAVLVGVIAGVGASIPCALLLLVVTRRRESEVEVEERYEEPRRAPAQPPVIVIAPGGVGQPQFPYASPYAYGGQPPGPQAGQRQFRVMGYESEDEPPIEGEVERVDWR